jgi:hypothetical protein
MLPPIALDWETPYSTDFSVRDLGAWKYARDPRCVPYLISVCDGAESWAGEPKEFNFESLRGRTLLSHHRNFDEEIALGAQERGLFEIPGLKPEGNDHWLCTLDMSRYLWNVASLKDACRIGLGITVSKDVRDRAKGKTVEDMKREGWWGEMVSYGQQDAERCWKLWDKHSSKWPEFERRLSRQTCDQGRYGIRIDVVALEQGMQLLKRVIHQAIQNLPWVARGRKEGSPIGVAEECRLNNIPCPPVKAHYAEDAQEWEDEYAPKFKFVMALKNLRKARKTLATLETIKLRLRDDETIAFSLKYAGAHTLRWAGDAGFNLQNMNREPMFIDPDYSFIFDKKLCRQYAEQFDDDVAGTASTGTFSSGVTYFDIRGLIIAREGMKLAPVDLAQIEPRVLNHLAGNVALLERIRQGMGIYEAFARDSLGWTGGELKTQDKKLYSLSKADVLGLGFKCGWEKFITVAMTMAGVDITEGDEDFARAAAIDGQIHRRRKAADGKNWEYDENYSFENSKGAWKFLKATDFAGPWVNIIFAKQQRKRKGDVEEFVGPLPVYGMRSRVTVAQFRTNNPLIVQLWEKLQTALEAAVGRDLEVEGPHLGKLIYRNVRRERREREDPETGNKYQVNAYTAEIGGRRYVLHAGVLCENLVQWVARMVFAERQLELHDKLQAEDPRQCVLFTVHDEAVPEILDPTDPKARAREIEATMVITPAWLEGCPLGAEAKILTRYAK